jgi:hypothetical protein
MWPPNRLARRRSVVASMLTRLAIWEPVECYQASVRRIRR